MDLKMPQKRNFISIMDWSSEELLNNLERALKLNKKKHQGQSPKELEGQAVALLRRL